MSLKLVERKRDNEIKLEEEGNEAKEILEKTEEEPLKRALCLDYLKLKKNLEELVEGGGLSMEKRVKSLKEEVVKEVRKAKPRACAKKLGEEGESSLSGKLMVLFSECID